MGIRQMINMALQKLEKSALLGIRKTGSLPREKVGFLPYILQRCIKTPSEDTEPVEENEDYICDINKP